MCRAGLDVAGGMRHQRQGTADLPLSSGVFVPWQCVSTAVLTRGRGFEEPVGGIILTVGPPGKVNVFSPGSSRQHADLKKSSPSIHGSCTSATHTVKFVAQPPTFNVTFPLPSIGASSPVTVLSCIVVCSNCVPSGTNSGRISVAVDPVSTRAVHEAPHMLTGTWPKFPA